MLTYLRIENLALLEAVELEFAPGFTALTGETGAGKSVLLGALSLLAGNRAEKTLIRSGADQCTVEAILDMSDARRLERFLDQASLPACEEGQLLIKRVVARDKASRVLINGSVATLSQLQQLAGLWIDFHGPGEPQKLFAENEQLRLLDWFAGLRGQLAEYRALYDAWRRDSEQLERMRGEQRLSPDEAAFLQSQVEAIDALKLNPASLEELESQYQRLQGANERRAAIEQLHMGLSADKAVLDRLRGLLAPARALALADPSSRAIADRIESLLIEADDIAGDIRQLADEDEISPAEAQRIEARMDAWLGISRRYGLSLEQVLEKRQQMADRLALQGNLDEVLAQRQQQLDKTAAQLRLLAADLRSARMKAAKSLAEEALELLHQLGFPHARLAIDIITEKALGPTGDSACRFTFAPNAGHPPLPLNKIASSGEMARVLLALKSVLAASDATPVLVFDEVDANIGGEVASAVARLLHQLGHRHQVFCITHLPQVASVANHHFLVRKEQSPTTTSVFLTCLDHDPAARIDEFARMLGDRDSPAARSHAASLLATEHKK